jgi:hypothetical protein
MAKSYEAAVQACSESEVKAAQAAVTAQVKKTEKKSGECRQRNERMWNVVVAAARHHFFILSSPFTIHHSSPPPITKHRPQSAAAAASVASAEAEAAVEAAKLVVAAAAEPNGGWVQIMDDTTSEPYFQVPTYPLLSG